MEKNMSGLDRGLRILIAVAVGVLYYTGVISGTLGIILGVVALIFLLTSFVSICPLYTVLGISTCPVDKR